MDPLSEDLSNYAVPPELENMLESFAALEASYFADNLYQEIIEST